MPSVNEAFGNLNRTINEIFADRAREREARRQAQEEADDAGDSYSGSSYSNAAADRETANRLEAERAAEAERVARDRDLTERLENERRLEAENNAIEAEMNRLAKNDEIETEMRREEFAPLVDQIVVSAAKDDTPVSASDNAQFNEIAPEKGAFREAFDVIKEKVDSFKESLPEMIPEKLADYGLERVSPEAVMGADEKESAPTIGSAIKDKIFDWVSDKAFDKAYEHLKEQYVTAIQQQRGADPNDELDRNVTATAVEVHPLTGFLPRLVSSGFNIPRALYEQGKGYVEAGMKNLGLAVDSVDPKDER